METAAILQIEPGYFKVTGTLSLATVPKLRDSGTSLITDGPNESRFDLSDAIFQGSAGLALLISWMRWAESANKQIVYLNAPQNLKKIAAISEIGGILNLD